MDTQPAKADTRKVRTRFAPSPTGYLHVGSARTALFAYLYAKHSGGSFVLRVEDTDQARFIQGAIEHLIATLGRLGLDYDEGMFVEDGKLVSRGEYGPYLQSERKDMYREYAQKLIEAGDAYYCFCDEQRLDEVRKEQEALKKPTQYDRKCRKLTKEQVKENLEKGLPYVIRHAIPLEGETVVDDLVFGKIVIDNKNLDDQVLVKSDGFPTYHLAVVVDDHLMEITHVIRGDEWIPSTPKHILLYRSFGWQEPRFAHLPLILNKDRSKLSKRQGDVAVEDFLEKGYLPEALLNYVALLGWSPKTEQEIFTLKDLAAQFDISKVNKSAAVFDVDRLEWLNGLYTRKMPLSDLTDKLLPYMVKAGFVEPTQKHGQFKTKSGKIVTREFIEAVVNAEKDRLRKLADIADRTAYYFDSCSYDPHILIWKKSNLQATKANLVKLLAYLTVLDEQVFSSEITFEQAVKDFIAQNDLDNGSVLWPLRVALSGLEASPGPFQIASVLYRGYGKHEILSRVEQGIRSLD